MSTTKEQAINLISQLPEEASWDDIMYEMYVKKKIEMGIKAADEGGVVPHEEVKKIFSVERNSVSPQDRCLAPKD